MGHLVNPIAFRLGWRRHWIDEYYTDLRFYPELLHKLLRFRFFLNCFFSTKIPSSYFETYLISHFTFSFDLQGFGLNIFYYNSRMEPCWYDFADKIGPKPYGLRFFPKARHEPPTFAPWNRKSFSLLFMLYHYAVNGLFDQPYQYRLSFFKAYQDTLQPDEFIHFYGPYLRKKYKVRRSRITPSERECYIVLHMMRYRTLQELGRINYTFRGYGLRMVNYEAVSQTFFQQIFFNQITRPYFYSFFHWLRFLGEKFFLKFPLRIHFFQINNDQVSARFIAKFIGLRCRQGLSVKAALKPIRRDLRFSKKLALRLHYKVSELNRTRYERSGQGRPRMILPLLAKASLAKNRFDFLRYNLPSFAEFFLNMVRPKAYAFARIFFEKQIFFTFMNHVSAEAKRLFFLYGYRSVFFGELAYNTWLSYHDARFLLAGVRKKKTLRPASILSLTGAVLLSFLNFSVQASAPPRVLDSYFGVKRRDFRITRRPAIGLQGFRIRLHGRFTRKQIAAAYHFQEGSMSLSSMDVFMDYGFATIPLRNSAIGIKVWLAKGGSPDSSDFHFTF
jgi:hypothetical protein